MSKLQPDDAFLINREGKDYKATVNQLAKDITIHVECGNGGGPVHWDDIEDKPCIPECPPSCEAEYTYLGYIDPEDHFGRVPIHLYVDFPPIDIGAAVKKSKLNSKSITGDSWLWHTYQINNPKQFPLFNAPNDEIIAWGDDLEHEDMYDYAATFELDDGTLVHVIQTYNDGPADAFSTITAIESDACGTPVVHWDDIVGKPCIPECPPPCELAILKVEGQVDITVATPEHQYRLSPYNIVEEEGNYDDYIVAISITPDNRLKRLGTEFRLTGASEDYIAEEIHKLDFWAITQDGQHWIQSATFTSRYFEPDYGPTHVELVDCDPSGGGGGTVHWDDIEGKPCLVECPDCLEFKPTSIVKDGGALSDSDSDPESTTSESMVTFYVPETPELLKALELLEHRASKVSVARKA